MNVAEFNLQLNVARTRVERDGPGRLPAEQERLSELVPELPESERAWATDMIDWLPELTAPPPPPTPLMLEALEIQQAAAAQRGTREERIAALAAARKKIWQLADTAPRGEGARIRGLTRTLEHLQDSLTDPFWEIPDPEQSE